MKGVRELWDGVEIEHETVILMCRRDKKVPTACLLKNAQAISRKELWLMVKVSGSLS